MKTTRAGVALVLVLWLVVVLAAVTAAAVALSRSEANSVIAYRSRAVARAAAASGAELAVAMLRRELATASTPASGLATLDELRDRLELLGTRALGQGRFRITVVDLTGRVPINTADYVTLLRLFEYVAGKERAPALAAQVMDWIDFDDSPRPDGAEATQYEEAGSPYRPMNRPFQRIEEIGRLLAVDDSLAAVLDTLVTIHGEGFVNVNTAPVGALVAATGMDPASARSLVRGRRGGSFRSLDQVRAALGSQPGFVPVSLVPSRLMIVSRGWADGRPYTREIRVVVELQGGPEARAPAAVVAAWEERDL